MASRRRNMFYKNKKQETTEIGQRDIGPVTRFEEVSPMGGFFHRVIRAFDFAQLINDTVSVNSRNEWDKVLEDFNVPKYCVNSTVGIKQIYLRYLDRYEKVHYLGEVGERAGDDDEDSRHRRWSARSLHSVPLTYNHSQHNVNVGWVVFQRFASSVGSIVSESLHAEIGHPNKALKKEDSPLLIDSHHF
ncbi:hypothetical protein AAG570_007856 [Ranatra chinensis]|uniref:ARID domain-containing protein n=1 Tax=Ranatra chinensis TaxID=642074 RepID=A0ABD0Y8C0_9HEMI